VICSIGVIHLCGKKRASTSIRIDKELWKEAKIEAIRRDMQVSELLELALRKELGLELRQS